MAGEFLGLAKQTAASCATRWSELVDGENHVYVWQTSGSFRPWRNSPSRRGTPVVPLKRDYRLTISKIIQRNYQVSTLHSEVC